MTFRPAAPVRILAISGSLRPDSSNTALLRALEKLTPEGVEFVIYTGLAELPYFDPSLKVDPLKYLAPAPVMAWREALAAADGVIFCTPEYAFGMPGVLKNALDWTVSMAVLERTPVAAISAAPGSSGGKKAHQGLLWVLTALGTEIVPRASFSIPLIRTQLNAAGEVTDPALRGALENALQALLLAVVARRAASQ